MAVQAMDNSFAVVDMVGDLGVSSGAKESDDNAGDDRKIAKVIQDSGMGRQNRDLDVTTDLITFPAPALYDEDDHRESDLMLDQGLWFDLRALEEGGSLNGMQVTGGWPAEYALSGPKRSVGEPSFRITMWIW